jgi:hypothetical protein
VNSQSPVGIITVETGGNAQASKGGNIVADQGGILTGAGTYTGLGLVKHGGAVMPGGGVGVITWNGSINFESGSLLDLEIAGPTAGTQYDVLNISGTCTMNGALSIRFLGNVGGTVQPGQSFDVLKAAGGIMTNLAGSRVSVFGSTGSFLIQLVDNGTTMRLTDFQAGQVTFSNWASAYGLSGADASFTADPNHNGLSNLLEYALGLDPTAVGGSRGTSFGVVTENGQKYLSLSYTKPTGNEERTDIAYTPQRATSLAPDSWSATSIVPVSTLPGPGGLETVTVRSAQPISSSTREFLRLSVSVVP